MRMHVTRPWSARMAVGAMAVAAITGISACSSSTPMGSSTSQATGQHMTASDFSTALTKPGTIVLDVRTPAEFASGHLPQAQNIDIEAADFATRIAALDKNATYAVYCHSGNRSGVALEQMAGVGFTHLYDLAGGVGAWQGMGGPMVMGGS
ncbi:MAG: rhodanese-like domain-containing protein [Dermatophilaceae bacterium]